MRPVTKIAFTDDNGIKFFGEGPCRLLRCVEQTGSLCAAALCREQHVDAVVETKRGHNLGRVLWSGGAAANTGIPGIIGGFSKERVIHCPAKGILRNVKHIIDTVPVKATLDGILGGLIRDGYPVNVGFKMADIDPRAEALGN